MATLVYQKKKKRYVYTFSKTENDNKMPVEQLTSHVLSSVANPSAVNLKVISGIHNVVFNISLFLLVHHYIILLNSSCLLVPYGS